MPLPSYAELMLPMLTWAGDGRQHTVSACRDALARQYQLSKDDLAELTPGGGKTTWVDRVSWAKTYLTKAGLLKQVARGVFQITRRGQKLLDDPPPEINAKFLMRYAEARQFLNTGTKPAKAADEEPANHPFVEDAETTPREAIDRGLQRWNQRLFEDIRSQLENCSPAFFEHLIVDLMLHMGYGGSWAEAGRVLGRSGDGGIDGVIKEDPLGLSHVYLQAKRWQNTVGSPEVDRFAGAMVKHQAIKGVLVTTSSFSQPARDAAARVNLNMVLIDGRDLAKLMVQYGCGVVTVDTISLKSVDANYFDEES